MIQRTPRDRPTEGSIAIRDRFLAKLVSIFCVALILRVIVLIGMRDCPTFFVPVMDEADYDALARGLLGHGRPITPLYWQSVFYPLWLTCVYFFPIRRCWRRASCKSSSARAPAC